MLRHRTFMTAALSAACLLPDLCAAELAASAHITVRGAIYPPACSIVLEQGGEFDYGGFSLLDVPEDRPLLLERKTLPISLNCSDPARMRLKVRDERAGTAATGMLSQSEEAYLFGLGVVAGKKPGAFKLSLQTDSFKGYRAAARTPEDLAVLYAFSDNVWYAASGGHFKGDGSTQMSFGRRGQTTPGSYVTVSGKLAVEAWVDRRSRLPGGQRIELAGSVMLELYYH